MDTRCAGRPCRHLLSRRARARYSFVDRLFEHVDEQVDIVFGNDERCAQHDDVLSGARAGRVEEDALAEARGYDPAGDTSTGGGAVEGGAVTPELRGLPEAEAPP